MAFGKRRSTYDNTNSGILFEVENPASQKHPSYKGSLNVGGVDYWISGWDKETKAGPALSLKIEKKQDRRSEEDVHHQDMAPATQASFSDERNEPPPPKSEEEYWEPDKPV